MLAAYKTSTEPEFDHEKRVYHIDYDPESSWPVSTAVVLGLSTLVELDPLEMLPLNSVVDPDVLDNHVRSNADDAVLSFAFYGFHVSVRSDGHIEFESVGDQEPSAGPRTN